ncbi:MAG: hypothetical protein K8R88_12340 [Armatimonadetes bacterium]|nr:hypothetical protein [Armatimonadota bacterium]
MKIDHSTTLEDLAYIVCTAMDKSGSTAILSGGGAATVYAPDAYQSRDLDFILSLNFVGDNPSNEPLTALGFVEKGQTYIHPHTTFTLEFPTGPLAIGSELIHKWDTLRKCDQLLHILTPTDCVRDRLVWFLFNDDYSGLEQALAVAKLHPIDIPKIEKWCATERESKKFDIFQHRLHLLKTQ